MIKLDSILNAYIIGENLYRIDNRKLVQQTVPLSKAYRIMDGAEEKFMTSAGWRSVDEVTTSYEDWGKFYRFPFSYLMHYFIKYPDFVTGNALNSQPRMFYFDIECASDGTGRFPRAETDPMIMFGYALDEGEIHVEYIKDIANRPKGFEDYDLVKKFIDVISELDPDVIVSYNGWNFDMPYIVTRARKMGIPLAPLLRLSDVKDADRVMDMHLYAERERDRGSFGGRLHYDIYHVDVLRDQKLSGVKDKKMKTIGKHFLKDMADDIVELEEGIENTLRMLKEEPEKLIEYQKSDVMVTRGLAKVYFPLNITAANELKIPLGAVINRSNGTLATVHVLKQVLNERIIPDKGNDELFPELYELISENKKINKDIKKSFQGAYVDIYKTGKFPKIYKLDFASLYPSIIILFNLSYETVFFKPEEMTTLQSDRSECWRDFTHERTEHSLHLTIPDANYMRMLHVEVDQGHRGILPRVLAEGLARRKEIKKQMRGLDINSPEYLALDSQQNIVKVINNSIFGIMSNRFSIGYLPVGFTITGMGRHLIRKAIEFISDPRYDVCETSKDTKGEIWSDEWKRTNPVIEIDTDGVLINSKPNEDRVNALLTNYIEETFGIKNDVLRLEEEEFGMGFIKAMKNYILLEPGKTEPVIHGSSFKSSRAAPIVDRALKLMIDHIFKDMYTPEEVVEKALDFTDTTIDDFKVKIRMSKQIHNYKLKGEKHVILIDGTKTKVEERGATNESQMIVKIADMYKDTYGYTPQKGDILEFIAVQEISTGKEAYIPFNKIRSTSVYTLDKQYYRDTILTILKPIMPEKVEENTLEDILEF